MQGRPPQQQQGQMQQPPGQPGQDVPPPPLNGQDLTLSNVLHFLQSEWRKYERDRNEWEIERAEMRASERRSFENVKLDLMRRIKMLEYALRMERSKQLSQQISTNAPQVKTGFSQTQAQKDDPVQKEESNGSSSPRSEDSPLPPESRIPNGIQAGSTRSVNWGAGSTWSSGSGQTGILTGIGKPPPGRDPKSRVRSREYLKQCLQEISYLTSPQANNPLPSRSHNVNNSSLPVSLPNIPPFDQMAYGGRPRKTVNELGRDFPLTNGAGGNVIPSPATSAAIQAGRSSPSSQQPLPQQPQPQQNQPLSSQPFLVSQASGQDHLLSSSQTQDKDRQPFSEPTTAIFRPDADWKERLRQSHEAAEQAGLVADGDGGSWRARDEEEDGKDEEEAEEDVSSVMADGEGAKVWKTKRTLRNHLDAVRAIAFHPTELCIATGGDDCTVKIWRMDVNNLASTAARAITEVEPQLTFRGHTAAITCLVIAPSRHLLYSASMDSTIRVWALPPASHSTYAPFDSSRLRGELIGHTDVVWDLALVRDEDTLISCGAEGSVKVWDVNRPSGGSLRLSWAYNGVHSDAEEHEDLPGACAVEAVKADLNKVAVAFQNATIKIFNIENGAELTVIHLPASSDDGPNQVNSLVSHPTMPLLIAGHEDKFISIFDINSGQCMHSMPAHLDGIASLSIDPAGFFLVSGSHDCSIRVWDVLGARACVQEIPSHRKKGEEGVLDVQFHPTLPFMASAGADGVVKLYASS
ncbi:WD40-repeat-containing domain protein [Vararia minispora EC-137]|uniref:WD40-repeat-containing domain protein n=1 Tax=Vararia minispora EC-137 TaxID=1314806 RepID=A0ACB8Q9P8_9AGAM|nr:WD40-repeat-containing domain protein [Vararia minispora EC-137]